MDRRSWPWKKKSSEKTVVVTTGPDSSAPLDSAVSQGDQGKKDDHKKPKYVQISVESYSHLTGLEDQVKSYEEQVKSYEEQVNTYEEDIKELNEQLSEATTEMTNKENLVKQHAKVAEEAVSGWEKAEAEAAALKSHLESVTLLKLTAEDRAAHLDGALKECMRQIRNLKEEHEQNLHDVILSKTKQFDKVRLELEARISSLDQELLRSAAENAALSRSLQDRSNMLIKLNEEKSQAEAEIELLKRNIESCQKEINSLKYEVHIVTKELEIRNEEKNMSARSAEVANKQHLEGVKKIAKLEAECQRLRGLVRKKLPGPAALAQMKLEVESLGRDHGESRLRRSPVKPPVMHLSALPEFSTDSSQKYYKENQMLTERLLAMEEETKMLKEALAKRNSELQASRSACAKTASKLQSLEAQLLANGVETSPPKSSIQIPIEGSFSQNASNPPSLTSMSEDGNEDTASCAGSWATGLLSEISHLKKEKTTDSPRKSESSNHLELMDDFLEMERLAYLSNDSNGEVSGTDLSNNIRSPAVNHNSGIEGTSPSAARYESDLLEQPSASKVDTSEKIPEVDVDPLVKLQSRLSAILESLKKETDIQKVLEDLKQVVEQTSNSIHPRSETVVTESMPALDSSPNGETGTEMTSEDVSISEEFAASISKIHDFIAMLGKEAKTVQGISMDSEGLGQMLDDFHATYNEIMVKKADPVQFISNLSHVLSRVSELQIKVLGYKISESETNNSDCIDKVALPENKGFQDMSDRYSTNCAPFSDSGSDADIPHGGSLVPTSELTPTSCKFSLEEYEQLKLEKNNLVADLAGCTESLEIAKTKLQETEQQLAEVKSQLTSAQKTNSLAETQLKCMAESYKSLETRAEELQNEVNTLRETIHNLDNELQEERRSNQDAVSKCKDLEEELQRIKSSAPAEVDAPNNQERELAAAAEKLAECQETIYLLGKQLKSLRPPPEANGSPSFDRGHKEDAFGEEASISGMNLQDVDPSESDTTKSTSLHRAGSESPIDSYPTPFSPDSEVNNLLRSPTASKTSKHRPTKSGSSSTSSTPTPEKHARGLSRFFSSKAKVSN
ncbi:OLC1v1018189C4 [Oldenlandia corymbosa var. corymbosa]|nr:OLC1v1018189C4 [Oldenlandia corymbosa var. corymbosa]